MHAELEGQGSGGGDAGQDVGSPLKKMRMGSGMAHARDAGTTATASIFANHKMHMHNPVLIKMHAHTKLQT